MSSTAPRTLGPYEIVAPLGSGGMGEVYRARDSRLNREVAIKLLRGDIANDPALKARFEREAKTVASLNHPNIVALFEVGNADGVEYTVSELVDGESLRALLSREGALPVRRVVELATQMADGMAAAHAAGIVHRDLKPENVMVTREGRVKILDFGLARIAAPGPARGAASSAETMVASAATMLNPAQLSASPTEYKTGLGMVMGTAAYMSPEQARGQEADYRADQFSFGVVLYEMLTGKQAFVRPSAVETMSAIIRDEPEPLDAKIPVALRWIVDRCLQKDPGQRFDSTKDLYQQLRTLRDHYSEAFQSQASDVKAGATAGANGGASGKRRTRRWPWLAAVPLAFVLGAIVVSLSGPSGHNLSKYRYTPFAVNASHPLWSPDGKMAVYTSQQANGTALFLRTLDSPTPRQLTHAEGTVRPLRWLPDSSHILYLQSSPTSDAHKVYSVGTVGGDPDLVWTVPQATEYAEYSTLVAIAPDGRSAAMLHRGADGFYDIYISEPIGSPLRKYPSSHVASRSLWNYPSLDFAPDGKQLLLIRAGDSGSEENWLLPWPAGSGSPRQVMKKLPHDGGTARTSWMPDGRHLVVSTFVTGQANTHLYLADTGSNALRQITQGTYEEGQPSVSPDGKAVLYTAAQNDMDILSMSLADGSTTPLIATAQEEAMPSWAANADSLVYWTNRTGDDDLWLHTKNDGDRPLITNAMFTAKKPKFIYGATLSPDGQRVIFVADTIQGIPHLWEAAVAGGAPVPLLDSAEPGGQATGDWSPDGKRFAFLEERVDGKVNLAVVGTGGGAAVGAPLANDVGGDVPAWSPDGQWIAYSDAKSAWHLISPDGTRHRDLGVIRTPALGFAKDSRAAYGLRNDDGGKWFLFSLDLASDPAKLHDIKQVDRGLQPVSNFNPGIRFSLAPDGKSFAYSIAKDESAVWMLKGWR